MTDDPDDDSWPAEMVSLCEECAKHSELKALIGTDLRKGVCASSASQVYNPARFEEVRNLVRALIRLHFNEEDYNPHWGGTSIDHILLGEQNPILETSKSDRYADEFIHRITWEGDLYPDPAKGIWLYAGSDEDGGRDLQFSIPQTNCSELVNIERSLEHQNFHAVESAMEKLVAAIEADIEFEVQENSLWYRGRIGVADSVIHIGDGEVTRIATPYKGTEIGARKQAEAEAGRMNRPGVSDLYLASEAETALAEIRPHPRHMISVGGFRAQRSLRIARFDLPIRSFSSSDRRLKVFALIYHIDSLLSLPIIPEERHRYAATQLLADVLIRHGFEGVTYRSSVGEGKNLCAFTPSAFVFDEAASAVKQVEQLHYTFSDVATSTLKTDAVYRGCASPAQSR